LEPLRPGRSDTTVLPATADMAEPDGSNGSFARLIRRSRQLTPRQRRLKPYFARGSSHSLSDGAPAMA
jgi:hypothetical protein